MKATVQGRAREGLHSREEVLCCGRLQQASLPFCQAACPHVQSPQEVSQAADTQLQAAWARMGLCKNLWENACNPFISAEEECRAANGHSEALCMLVRVTCQQLMQIMHIRLLRRVALCGSHFVKHPGNTITMPALYQLSAKLYQWAIWCMNDAIGPRKHLWVVGVCANSWHAKICKISHFAYFAWLPLTLWKPLLAMLELMQS